MRAQLLKQGLIEKFATLTDPRIERTKKHSMTDILVSSICGQEWFKTFLELPNGIPSPDTFGRLYAALAPVALRDAPRRAFKVSLK